ncbi:MAG TPA: sigma-70 family RNA polymerase sigma factor [Dongiaceae bacterium]|nr:sigma-70 family RNA polymerase sigma factor [Dongiaceae bacterium]
MPEMSDIQLLRDYAEHGREAAFRELVVRYTDLVYSAALRQVEATDAAADITQGVFLDLARKAGTLSQAQTPASSLAGWLHRATRYAALNHLRDTRRRRLNESQAMEQLLARAEPAADWEQIHPVLDEALDSLDDADREALLLRYFKNLDFRTVGAPLSISDDAAQKRTSRAVERLREYFGKHGVTVGTGGLTLAISANAVSAAPVALATTITAAAAVGGTATTLTVTTAATKAIAMTTLQKIIVTVTVAALAGTGIYEARQSAMARSEAQSAQQKNTALTAQIERLQQSLETTSNQLADLLEENRKVKQNPLELLKLRGDVSRLQMELLQATQPTASPTEAQAWLARVNKLKQRLEATPKQQIPELAYLTDQDWLDAARHVNLTNAYSLDKAFYQLRLQAKKNFATQLEAALRQYAQANNNQAPDNVSQLQAYLGADLDPALLQRYEMIQSGTLNPEQPAIAEKAPPDTAFTWDSLFKIGTRGYWWVKAGTAGDGDSGQEINSSGFDAPAWVTQLQSWQSPPPPEPDVSAEMKLLAGPIQAYQDAHGGKQPEGLSDIKPYLQNAAEKTAVARLVELGKQQDQAVAQNEVAGKQFFADEQVVFAALAEYTKAHAGAYPQNPSDLQPYLKTPDAQAAWQRVQATIGKP